MENFSELLGQMREYCMDTFHLVNLNLRSIRLLIMLIFLELTLHSSFNKKKHIRGAIHPFDGANIKLVLF